MALVHPLLNRLKPLLYGVKPFLYLGMTLVDSLLNRFNPYFQLTHLGREKVLQHLANVFHDRHRLVTFIF